MRLRSSLLVLFLSICSVAPSFAQQKDDPELLGLIERLDDPEDTIFKCMTAVDGMARYVNTHKPSALAYLYLGRAWSKTVTFNADCGQPGDIMGNLDSAEAYYGLAAQLSPTIRDRYLDMTVRQLINHLYGTRAMWSMQQDDTEAVRRDLRMMKKRGYYEPSFMSGELVLKYCDKNAILLTLGDDDTFPLWYYQFVEGLRPDVTVVNLSLLATEWYQKVLRSGIKASIKPLTFEVFGYPDGDYSDEWMQKYEILSADAADTTTPNIFPIHASVRDRYAKISGTDPARQWKTTAFKLGPMGEDYFSAIGAVALQSIIENNEWRRPVDVSWSWFSPTLNGLDRSMLLKGPISEIIPAELEVPENGISAIDTESLGKFLMDETSSLMDMIADTQAVSYADPLIFRTYYQYFIGVGLDKEKVLEQLPGMRKISKVDPIYLRSGYQSLITTLASNGFMLELRKDIELIREELARSTKGAKSLNTEVEGYLTTLYLLQECKEFHAVCKSLLKTLPEREDRARLLDFYDAVKKDCVVE